jgi:hypothetical protein
MSVVRCLGIAAASLVLLGVPACSPSDPGAEITLPDPGPNPPQDSEEAARQIELQEKAAKGAMKNP